MKSAADNAILAAKTPNWTGFWPSRRIRCRRASTRRLADGQMGNSEVGHTNIGAGRVVMQDLPRIDAAIQSANWPNPALKDFIARLKQSGGAAHLMGLMSPGGVHSHQAHIAALARLLAEAGSRSRSMPSSTGATPRPRARLSYLAAFEAAIRASRASRSPPSAAVITPWTATNAGIAWKKPMRLVAAEGEKAASAKVPSSNPTPQGKSDEFVLPAIIGNYAGMKDGDGLVCANFRADRVRQLLASLLDPEFPGFQRPRVMKFSAVAGMTEYSDALNPFLKTLFPPEDPADTFGEVIVAAGLKQLRIAETEKYAHVTFFFNGGREEEFPGEGRILVPSPKVATYDLKPEMSAIEVTEGWSRRSAGEASTSSWSITPMPTWSGIPATSPPRSRRWRRSMPAWGGWRRR